MQQTHVPGDQIEVHFVWQLPDDGDIIRAIFRAEVLTIIEAAQKYMVRLVSFAAGRQESTDGRVIRPQKELAFAYWQHVVALIGCKVTIAFEVADGTPIYLRLATLTGEHDFFRRYNQPLDQLRLDKYGKVIKR